MSEIPDFDDREWNPPDEYCKHNRTGYCFDCVRERHNQEVLDGKYDDLNDDYVSTYDERDNSTWS